MKRTQILATLAFAFMLGAAIPFIELASSADVSAADQAVTLSGEEAEISTPQTAGEATPQAELGSTVTIGSQEDLATLREALKNTSVSKIVLDSNIDLSVALGGGLQITRPASAPLELDLNGHNIIGADTTDSTLTYAIFLNQGNLHITGTGKISGRNAIKLFGATDSTVSEYSILKIDQGVTLEGIVNYGLAIVPTSGNSAYGVKVDFDGTIIGGYGMSTLGTIKQLAGEPQITIGDHAVLNTRGGAIYAAGYANWKIGTATLSGDMGIGIKAGKLTLTGTKITSKGEPGTPGVTSNGIQGNGVVFNIEHNPDAYADNIEITINGGKYISQKAGVFYEYDKASTADVQTLSNTNGVDLATIVVEDGDFISSGGHPVFDGTMREADIEIDGGKFTSNGGTGNIFRTYDADTDITIKGGTFDGQDEDVIVSYLEEGLELNEDGEVVDPNAPATPSRPGGSTGSVNGSEGPSTDKEPSDSTPDQNGQNGQNTAPNTGLNSKRGALTAASTVIPVLCGMMGVTLMVALQKAFSRKKALNETNIEMEIDAQLAELAEEPEEPVVDHFVAEAIAREEPKVTPVDTFILHK